MIARARKAAVAAAGAFLTAAVSALAEAALDGAVSGNDVSQAIGLGVAAAVALGWGVWRVPNAPDAR